VNLCILIFLYIKIPIYNFMKDFLNLSLDDPIIKNWQEEAETLSK